MMVAIYNFSIFLFTLGLRVVSLFNSKASKIVEGRKATWKQLEQFSQHNYETVIWFHAASLGEFEQGRPIMERLKLLNSDVKIVLSFFSSSGYEVRKNFSGADLVVYLPTDSVQNARKFIDLVRPKAAIFIKYEFWYHFLKLCAETKVLTLSTSSIFRTTQPFFKSYGQLHRKMLSFFDHFFVQNENSKKLLAKVNIQNVLISGDTRFDRVLDIANQKKPIPKIEQFKSKELVMVLGSVWPNDMDVLIPFFKQYKDRLKFIIAPHNIGENDIQEIVDQLGNDVIRFSKVEEQDLGNYRYMIIDNMGMLSSLYGYGEFAYVGGAFRKTLHNTLEAATYGVPVFFGEDPTNSKFQEAIDLANLGAGIPVKHTSELIDKFDVLLNNESMRKTLGKMAAGYVSENTGATEMIVNYLTNKLSLT